MTENRSVSASVAASATPALLERVSWGAVLAGAAIALALMIVLNLLGFATGLYVLDAQDQQLGAGGALTTMGVWWLVSLLFALFVGGWAAGRLTGNPSESVASLHGLAVWSAAVLVSTWMVASATSAAFTGAAGLVGRAAQTAGQGAASVADALEPATAYAAAELTQELQAAGVTASPAQIRTEVEGVINQAVSPAERQRLETLAQSTVVDMASNPAQARAELSQFVSQAFGSNGVIGPEDREQAVSALSDRLGVPEAELRQTFDRWQASFTGGAELDTRLAQIERDMAVVTEDAADATADAAMWTGFGLLFALAASVGGALLGRPHEAAAPFARTSRAGA